MEGHLIVVSGPSGVGKTTIVKRLLETHPEGIELSVSATTRPPRPGERDGVDYRFWSPARFEEGIRKGEFLEHAEVYGNLYGTPRAPVERALSEGRHVILEIDTQGAESIRRLGRPAVFVFIAPPSLEILEGRLRRRGTPPELMERRLREAKAEMDQASRYDTTVVNDTVERAVEELRAVLCRRGLSAPLVRTHLFGGPMDKEALDQLAEKVGGKPNLILILQKRYHELIQGDPPRVENPPTDLIEVALEEVKQEKIDLTPPPPPPKPERPPRPRRDRGGRRFSGGRPRRGGEPQWRSRR